VVQIVACRANFAALQPADAPHRPAVAPLFGCRCKAKHWVRQHARGSERFGRVASSKPERLESHGTVLRRDAAVNAALMWGAGKPVEST
jgi:hypothetical protein